MSTVTIPRDLAARIAKRLEDFNDSEPPCQGYQSQELMTDRRAFEAALAAPTPQPVDLDRQTSRRIVSARLAADTDGYGSVYIHFAGGFRLLLPLDEPHARAAEGGEGGQ